MRRKEEPDQIKKKQTQKQESLDYSIDTQISILLPYLKIMPISMQLKFLMPLKQVADKENISEINSINIDRIVTTAFSEGANTGMSPFLTDLFCGFLKLNKLKESLANVWKRSNSREKNQQHLHEKDHPHTFFHPFQPNIQKQSTKFEPIPSIINPNYENLIKMYKTFTDVHINMQYKIKDLNQNYTFFAQPRFISKVLQIKDFESAFPEKGNIAMMSFQGSKIIGKRGFAFVNQSAIYWWQKNYKDIKDILPEFKQEKQKQGRSDRRKQDEKDVSKNEIVVDTTKYNQNFKLTYKMVGHHGKITSLSLSDDQYYLISAGTDKVIKLWCLRQKCLLAEYRGHLKTIWSVSFNKSGYFFLSGSADKTIKLWSTDDSIAQRIFMGHQADVLKVDFMKNPDLIVSASEDKTVKIWNTLTTQCINTFKFDRQVINFKTSISGRYLVTCDQLGKMTLFDMIKGEILSSFMIPEKEQYQNAKKKFLKIHDMCISMDEKQFACVSNKYIVIYSFDKICEKQSKNIFVETGKQTKEKSIATKQVIYTGRDSNLVYCDYLDKGLLLVATTSMKKY